MWYPIAVPSPIAVHGPISGPKKDRYRAVDRYSGRSYRSKRPEFRFDSGPLPYSSPRPYNGPT